MLETMRPLGILRSLGKGNDISVSLERETTLRNRAQLVVPAVELVLSTGRRALRVGGAEPTGFPKAASGQGRWS